MKNLINVKKYLTKKNIVTFLCIVEMIMIISTILSLGNKDSVLASVKVDGLDNSLFAILLEGNDGEYIESSTNEFPHSSEYRYNQSESFCVDLKGKKIENSLVYDLNLAEATVSVKQSVHCYLYFDQVNYLQNYLIRREKEFNLWQSGLEGDGYRFIGSSIDQCSYDGGKYINGANSDGTCKTVYKIIGTIISSGANYRTRYGISCPTDTDSTTYSCTQVSGTLLKNTNPNNYVCFGTSNKDECTGNLTKYMYRIIGIFSDETGINHVKLIKYAGMPNRMEWNSNREVDINWDQSELFNYLNGDKFLDDVNYIPNNAWKNKIANWKWTAVNTLLYESGGPDYFWDLTTKQIYLHEMNRDSKQHTIGEWTYPNSKISLMYASDYVMSLGTSVVNMDGYYNGERFKTGWIYIRNNINLNPTNYADEWTMSRAGCSSIANIYDAIIIRGSDGYVSRDDLYQDREVRPVFYLTEYNEYQSGKGTLEDPFIIASSTPPSVDAIINGNTLTATFTKGDNELYGYCINKTPAVKNCDWLPITSLSITKELDSYGTYYIHLVDVDGYLAHSGNITYVGPSLVEYVVSTGELWQSGLEGDGYRYTGTGAATADTSPKNFVCFGTSDKATCTENSNNYMYRIIGVFSDKLGNNHVKLIKYFGLPNSMTWNDINIDVNWENSTLNENLNGMTFLTNTTYVPNSTWSNKITNWEWTAVDTKGISGPNYKTMPTQQMYLHEMNRSSKSSTIGIWTTSSAKIGVMYASDYQMSLGANSLNYTGSSNNATLKTGWMHITNNRDTTNMLYEWTIARYNNMSGQGYLIWIIDDSGSLLLQKTEAPYIVRPVFYLESNVKLLDGTGTLANPYMIQE